MRRNTTTERAAEAGVTPERIMQVGIGFWPAKVLLGAIKLGLFTKLAGRPKSAAAIAYK